MYPKVPNLIINLAKNKIPLIIFLQLFLFSNKGTFSQTKYISLPPLFSDGMVLQQNQEIPVWGKAEAGSKIVVSLNGNKNNSIADENGNWKVYLPPLAAGGPYELTVSAGKEIKIKNVMIGEVWLCSGQSNMEMPLAGWGKIKNYKEEIANAKYPAIRLLTVNKKMANVPQENFESDGWKECSPETIPDFSAVAYFFGRKLYKELNVPIGLIQSAWGGTVVEAWTSGETLKKIEEFTDIVSLIENDSTTEREKIIRAKKKLNEWPDKIEEILKEKGTFNHGYQNVDYKTNNWKTMELPTLWEDKGLEIDGVVWFSKTVIIPNSWKNKNLTLSLGKINDYDITWFNGKRVGRGVDVVDLRTYNIPSSLVKVGENKITVQVLDIGNVGGLYGPANKMKLINDNESIPLTGIWKYKIEPDNIDVRKLPEKPTSNTGANRPTVLYNAMINPLVPFGIKGAIWYQGESNAERAYQYRELFSAMIKDWRNKWSIGKFPFYFVQLANFKKIKPQPADDSWAELREAQTMALKLPNTGMAVTIDIGDAKNIHPKNKQEVGRRLALNALANTYGKDIPHSGPLYSSMKIEGNKIRIQFTNTDGGLSLKNGEQLKGFAIAGRNKKFIWAKAEIVHRTPSGDGNEVVVWNSKIKNPVAVRYAWAANPVCNLYNGAGLPASPFRTDDWKGITYGKK